MGGNVRTKLLWAFGAVCMITLGAVSAYAASTPTDVASNKRDTTVVNGGDEIAVRICWVDGRYVVCPVSGGGSGAPFNPRGD